jgi:hypothetical protein
MLPNRNTVENEKAVHVQPRVEFLGAVLSGCRPTTAFKMSFPIIKN